MPRRLKYRRVFGKNCMSISRETRQHRGSVFNGCRNKQPVRKDSRILRFIESIDLFSRNFLLRVESRTVLDRAIRWFYESFYVHAKHFSVAQPRALIYSSNVLRGSQDRRIRSIRGSTRGIQSEDSAQWHCQ